MLDDKKRKELEALRKQINPEILKKVANSMGAAIPGVSGPSPSAPASAPASSARSSAPASRVRDTSSDLSELKAKIRRQEKMEIDPESYEKKKVDTAIIVYDKTFLNIKKLNSYLNLMGFHATTQVTDPQVFLKTAITKLNDPEIRYVAGVAFRDAYIDIFSYLHSAAVLSIREKFPILSMMPLYFFIPDEAQPDRLPKGIPPQRFISMRLDPSFNFKKIRQDLENAFPGREKETSNSST